MGVTGRGARRQWVGRQPLPPRVALASSRPGSLVLCLSPRWRGPPPHFCGQTPAGMGVDVLGQLPRFPQHSSRGLCCYTRAGGQVRASKGAEDPRGGLDLGSEPLDEATELGQHGTRGAQGGRECPPGA